VTPSWNLGELPTVQGNCPEGGMSKGCLFGGIFQEVNFSQGKCMRECSEGHTSRECPVGFVQVEKGNSSQENV